MKIQESKNKKDYTEMINAIYASDLKSQLKQDVVNVIQSYANFDSIDIVTAFKNAHIPVQEKCRNNYGSVDIIANIKDFEFKIPCMSHRIFSQSLFKSYSFPEQAILTALAENYLNRCTHQTVTTVFDIAWNGEVSTETLHAIQQHIDQKIDPWRHRKFNAIHYEYVYAESDKIWLYIDNHRVSVPVYIVMGWTQNDRREILSYCISNQPAPEVWLEIFHDLKAKGLLSPTLLISSMNREHVAPILELYPDMLWQRSAQMFVNSVIKHLEVKNFEASDLIRAIYNTETKEDFEAAKQKWNQFANQHEWATNAKLYLDADYQDTMTYLNFPKRIQGRIKSSSNMGKIMSTIHRKCKVLHAFSSMESAYRTLGAILNTIENEQWINTK